MDSAFYYFDDELGGDMRNLTASILFLGAIILSALAGAEETLTFYHNDMLGSPVAASDKDGELLWTESYEPYGKKRGDKQSLNHRGYTGHAEDANTGLVYMQARYYDPLIGRFYSMDPVGYLGHLERGNPIQGMNRYAYANNNPYKYNDPDGEFLNFAIKFAADVALTAALNYAETGSLNLTGAVGEAAVGMLNPAKTLQKFNRVAKLYKKGGGCSFTPETLILTQDGYKAIIEVQVGDIVLSKNDITGELSWREVTDTFKDWHQETITFTVVDENGIQETITTTAEHPFYIAGQGWLPAGEIGIDTIFAGSSPESAIKVVGISVNDSPQYAYNFTVDTDHTYFVGKTDIWVHNTCEYDAAKALQLVNGRKPINSKYAGKTHPSGVKFNEKGFPDFSPYAKAQVDIKGLTGDYAKDAAMANKAVGLKRTPDGYVWHHVENAKTMQLIPQSIHNAARHTGGGAIIRSQTTMGL
ncbi:polymorphic toxin-type HINT domain-containing protein [Microbulbifer sp. VVAC002]|uniref:polymorphic toxin-type HINT domain-containing protein n=1 Tax=Microbulbifer sp. VVAC002 TaxID=3243387 RepID=UPI0040399B45